MASEAPSLLVFTTPWSALWPWPRPGVCDPRWNSAGVVISPVQGVACIFMFLVLRKASCCVIEQAHEEAHVTCRQQPCEWAGKKSPSTRQAFRWLLPWDVPTLTCRERQDRQQWGDELLAFLAVGLFRFRESQEDPLLGSLKWLLRGLEELVWGNRRRRVVSKVGKNLVCLRT